MGTKQEHLHANGTCMQIVPFAFQVGEEACILFSFSTLLSVAEYASMHTPLNSRCLVSERRTIDQREVD